MMAEEKPNLNVLDGSTTLEKNGKELSVNCSESIIEESRIKMENSENLDNERSMILRASVPSEEAVKTENLKDDKEVMILEAVPKKSRECSRSVKLESTVKVESEAGPEDENEVMILETCKSESKPNKRQKISKKSEASDFLSKLKANSKDKFVICPFCERRVKKNYFVRHARIHTGEKPFGCTECSYSASGSHALNKHKEDYNH